MAYNSLSTTSNSLRFWETHKYISSISVQNVISIDDDQKEISLSKETDFKIEVKL